MDKKQYLEYIDHFNNKRYDAVTSYFDLDIVVEYGDNGTYSEKPPQTLHGREEFAKFYKNLHEYVREVLELGDFMVRGNLLFAELYTEFHCFKDAPASAGLPWKKGEVSVMTNWVMYTLENDKMKHIRIAHFRMHDPKQAKY
jgi:hypothetical protein